MTISLSRRVTLRELMEQAWKQVEDQAQELLKRAVEGLLLAERDQRVAEARRQGEKVYPNPSVRPSRRRMATQRRIEPSEVPSETRFLALSNAEGLTTATLETVERRSAAVFYKSALQIRR